MRRRDPETRYKENIRRQQRELEEFAAKEIEWAEDLLYWYRLQKKDIPDDEYRGVAYFINKEFAKKPGSLTLLYILHDRLIGELPEPTRELAFDLLAYRFKKYGLTLIEGGF